MSQPIASLLLVIAAAGYALWQRSRLRQRLQDSGTYQHEWFQAVFMTGGIMTLAMVVNGIAYMKMAGFDYEMGIMEGREPSGSLLLTQLEVMAGTFALLAIVWRAVSAQSAESVTRGRRGQIEVMAAITKRLMPLFWLAALGVGSVFGVSSGFDLPEVLNHAELLLGPTLVLAVELTIMWLGARSMIKYFDLQS